MNTSTAHDSPAEIISFPTPKNEPSRKRVLVVEDDPLTRELHALVLETAGYDVETASDGIVALERCAARSFDLVITDRSMPNLDGASMVLALRSAGSRVPIVMVSGSLSFAPLPPQVACELAGAVPKPARTQEILTAVAHALRGTRPPADFGHPPLRPASPSALRLVPKPEPPARDDLASLCRKGLTALALQLRPMVRKSESAQPGTATTAAEFVKMEPIHRFLQTES